MALALHGDNGARIIFITCTGELAMEGGSMGRNGSRKASPPTPSGADPTAMSAQDALARAQRAANKLKRKDTAMYWALIAQTIVLTEIRDELQVLRNTATPGSVTLPDDAPARTSATASVTEP
ncbi:MAG: hypothetical protein ACRDSE_10185 [Pseudonocardiaceae bacterium]